MNISVQQAAAKRTARALGDVEKAARSTASQWLGWQPLETGRSVMDQLIELCMVNWKWGRILLTRVHANPPAAVEEEVIALGSLDARLAKLGALGQELQAAILMVPDDDLLQEIETPWGPVALWEACFQTYWQLVYHEGQINYIQTLYGDNEEHYT